VLAGYAVIAAMGVGLLGPARAAMDELAELQGAAVAVAAVGFLAGAAGAVSGVRYELAASTPSERMQRHLRMQAVSLVILGIGFVLFVTWTWIPALLQVTAATAGSGFILGFLAAFIPNRRRALEIRKINRVD
jgi:protein-S-isoprenylcysteine O-methyltransferase Ste14